QCDGERPLCGACVKRGDLECQYPVREGAVSRYADLKLTSEKLDRENRELKELFAFICSRPETEAFEVYRRLRATEDPFATLHFIKDADTLLRNPSPSGYGTAIAEVWKIDAEALAASVIKVPARPWTSVAGDGLVSDLVSAFFKWDDPFIWSLIDRELFIRDMRHASPLSSQFCSPFLVNALCAMRSVFSEKIRLASRAAKTSLASRFVAEAKHHLDLEAGRVCLTTIQGLWMMYSVSCHDGTNRAGSMYRLAALDMLSRMNLEKRFAEMSGRMPGEAESRRSLAKLHWGMFNIESVISNVYLKRPLIPPPSLPYCYDGRDVPGANTDIFGQPFGPYSPEPPFVPGTLPVMNQISVLQYRVIEYNTLSRCTAGGEQDMRMRRDFLLQLARLEASLPPSLRYRENMTPQTIYLKTYMNVVAYNILRPLHANTPVSEGRTAKAIMIDLCAVDADLLEAYIRRWGLTEYSSVVVTVIYDITLTLLPFLDEPRASSLFVRGCALLRLIQRELGVARRVAQGILFMARKMGQRIPYEAAPYFDGLEADIAELKSVPVDFALPVRPEMSRVLAVEDISEGRTLGADLAAVLEKWGTGQGVLAR
ncbi:hypothetical protein C8A03DRAFT_18175, partial [Achaetomium macrosporum]